MIGVSKDCNIRMQILQGVLCVRGGERQGLSDFLVYNDIDANTALGCSLQHPVQSVLFILGRGSSQVKLWGKPPYITIRQNLSRL